MPELATISVGDAVGRAATTLAEAGCDTPRLDAELLLGDVLAVDRSRLVVDAGVALDADVAVRFEQLVARRASREPVAYILGRKEFRRITLSVDRRVLVPRPETELLVEVGLSLAPGERIADVGTGSGAVALALKEERPDLSIVGLDRDPRALAVARENASRLGLDVTFAQADLLDRGASGQGRLGPGAFDVVLANLPYVADDDPLPPEVALYEPRSALFGGADGLDLVRRLVPMVAGVPVVALEVGLGQAGEVAALLRRGGFGSIEILRDLAGVERVVVGRSQAP